MAESGVYRCGRVGERLEPPRDQDTKKHASCGLESRRRREPSLDGVRARRGMVTYVLGGASVDVRDSRLGATFACAQRCQVVFDTLTRGFRRPISLQQPVRLLDTRVSWQSCWQQSEKKRQKERGQWRASAISKRWLPRVLYSTSRCRCWIRVRRPISPSCPGCERFGSSRPATCYAYTCA